MTPQLFVGKLVNFQMDMKNRNKRFDLCNINGNEIYSSFIFKCISSWRNVILAGKLSNTNLCRCWKAFFDQKSYLISFICSSLLKIRLMCSIMHFLRPDNEVDWKGNLSYQEASFYYCDSSCFSWVLFDKSWRTLSWKVTRSPTKISGIKEVTPHVNCL